MPTLSITSKAVAFSDKSTAVAVPLKKNFDWTESFTVPVKSPQSFRQENLAPGASITFFQGATGFSNDSAYTVTASPLAVGRYRFSWTGGTAPGFRADRLLAFSGSTITIAVNNDDTATMTLSGGADWTAMSAGDVVSMPGPVTGDGASPFNVLNQGLWVVMAVLSSHVIQVTRPPDQDFAAAAEAVVVTATAQVLGFSANGVQVGHKLNVTAGFSPATQKTFDIVAVSVEWIEVVSTTPIPLETNVVPGSTGLLVFSFSKQFIRVEATQECVVRINLMSEDLLRISPRQAGDEDSQGYLELWAPVWSLSVVNKSSMPANVTAHTCE